MAVSAKAAMLIRKPIREVFAAFVDPAITTKFWFTKSSGRLAPGARVRWEWAMYGASTEVTVRAFEQDERLVIEWSGYDAPNTVEWLFSAPTADTTFVSITNTGFSGDAEAVAGQLVDATEGFTMVLAGLKALLEHGILLNLVADRFPSGVAAQ
ncbi:MAG TPA: SRPBCC family protein [Thermomicrobiales bacterium]